MHIAVLSDPSNFHCEKWAGALAAAGAQVTVFTLDPKPAHIPGVEIVRFKAPFQAGGRIRYPSYWLTRRQLRRELFARKVDVVHPLHLTPFGTWALWANVQPYIPILAAAMGADVLEYPRDKAQQPEGLRTWRETEVQRGPIQRLKAHLLNRFFRARVQAVIDRSDLLTGDNMPLVDAMHHWFGAPAERTHLLRWGLEPELLDAHTSPEAQAATRAAYGIPPNARVVFSPRGANALYQADIILDAIARTLDNPTTPADTFFLVLGAGYPAAPSVATLAQRLTAQYPTRFRFIPHQIPRMEVYRLWAIMDVFITAPVYDGYSAALAEGRYSGAIPLANAIPGNLEVIQDGENGLIVHPFDAPTLAERLTYTLAHLTELKAYFAPRNRQWIIEHSLLANNARILVQWAEALLTKTP